MVGLLAGFRGRKSGGSSVPEPRGVAGCGQNLMNAGHHISCETGNENRKQDLPYCHGLLYGNGSPATEEQRTRQNPITGKAAFADYIQQKPGVFRKITVADLPPPHATSSVDNGPDEVERPKNAWPQAPPGFTVRLYAAGLIIPG